MRHVYNCQLRWGDMDSFGHVNNVVYADYLQEARWDFLASTGCTDLNFVVLASQRLVYVAPLTFDGAPVSIEVWVTNVGEKSFSLAYEVFRATDGVRTTYLRAYATQVAFDYRGNRQTRALTEAERTALGGRLETTDFEQVDFAAPDREPASKHPVQIRLSDIDLGGITSNVKYLEFFQEARVAMFRDFAASIGPKTPMAGTVVAQADIHYLAPVFYRPDAYECRTWVSHVGTKSIVLHAEFGDRGEIKARGRFVMVWFDVAQARAAEIDRRWRKQLTRGLR